MSKDQTLLSDLVAPVQLKKHETPALSASPRKQDVKFPDQSSFPYVLETTTVVRSNLDYCSYPSVTSRHGLALKNVHHHHRYAVQNVV